MSNNRSFDGLEFSSLDFPYNRVLRELSEDPRLVAGQNSYITYGGKLAKRPGTIQVTSNNVIGTLRADRFWIYETLDTPPVVFLVGSFYNAGSWFIAYNRLDANTGWVGIGNYRQIGSSTRPHEASVSRGKLYIKGFPSAASGEKLGSVIFDGTGGTINVYPWGSLGPTTPAAISGAVRRLNGAISSSATSFTLDAGTGLPAAPFNIQIDYELITVTANTGGSITSALRGAQGTTPAAHANDALVLYRDWGASNHPVTVNLGWEYTYAYVSVTGQVTNRAPLQTNPDSNPSSTGPFINLIPKIIVQGLADTTNFPFINIYRKTDGGGTFLFLQQVANTGAGNITYFDNSLASGAGNADPMPDSLIDTQAIAPSLTSNGPPPTVIAPAVVGTDTPAASTPIAFYAGRFWFGVGNILFYSANEELNTGVPEESWPSGLTGNFFRFQKPVINLQATTDGLYIFTLGETFLLTGTLRETFNPQPVLGDIGAPYGHPRAICRYGDAIVWLTNDLRVGAIQGRQFKVLSYPLGSDLITAVSAGAEIDIKYWADQEKEWIVVTAINKTTPSLSQQWVYDVIKSEETKQEFWNTPWTINCTALASGRVRESESQRRLVFWSFNPSTPVGILSRIAATAAENTGTDYLSSGAVAGYNFSATTALFQVPPGNHVNALRRPGLIPILDRFVLERTYFPGDSDPTASYYVDDIFTNPIPAFISNGPLRADDPRGYNHLEYPINQKGRRISLKFDKNDTDLFEVQNLTILFNSDKGV